MFGAFSQAQEKQSLLNHVNNNGKMTKRSTVDSHLVRKVTTLASARNPRYILTFFFAGTTYILTLTFEDHRV